MVIGTEWWIVVVFADEMPCETFGQFGVFASQSLSLLWYPIKRTLTKMEYRNTGLGTRQHQQNLPIRSHHNTFAGMCALFWIV